MLTEESSSTEMHPSWQAESYLPKASQCRVESSRVHWGEIMRSAKLARFIRRSEALAPMLLVLSAVLGYAQERAPGEVKAQASSLLETLRELQAQVRELNTTLLAMRDEEARSRAEIQGLRHELQEAKTHLGSVERDLGALRAQPTTPTAPPAESQNLGAPEGAAGSQPGERLGKLEEDQQLLSARIDEQYQTKIESASKYRVRLSGIVLLNVFGTRGTVDNQDLPNLALSRGVLDSGGNFGATMRQSELGLEVFGPKFGGAKTSGEAQMDFFGGFPNTLDGVTSGVVRLRTARVRLDWSHTFIDAGQEAPFLSPLSPTSIASLAVPAFSYAGNLWTWTPQIRVGHRVDLSDSSSISLEAGILDPLVGEPPPQSFNRLPQAGERARQPAYAARVAWTQSALGRPVTFGVGGYYGRQNWGFGRTVDAWAATADWNVPLGRCLALTGEFYRGRALGGLGGGVGRSALWSGPLTDPATSVLGLNSVGGWTQLKFKPAEKFEFNGAVGEDNPLASDLGHFPQARSYLDASIARNQSAFVNFIYRPRSNLLLALEYRRLKTFSVYEAKDIADHLNLSLGVLF